ncbi:MAG: hypothetical protein IJ849_02230 [Selenomonadaceae bacterium]|nr:hypothetical protein [Selenomonadaceae bacterium]
MLELLAAATRDDRYVLEYDKEKERPKDMDAWLTKQINGGIVKGITKGENRLGELIDKLLSLGRSNEAREAATNPTRRMELYREYNIAIT